MGEATTLVVLPAFCPWCRLAVCVAGRWEVCTPARYQEAAPYATHWMCPDCLAVERARIAGDRKQRAAGGGGRLT